MSVKKYFCGNEMEKMPNVSFKIMSFMFRFRDYFFPVDKRLDSFGIKKGFTVIDYGCGTGSYLKKTSQLVGEKGKVYSVDIHELAIKSAKKKIEKYNLKNVELVLAKGYSCKIKSHVVDMIYALDMFHMIKEPNLFLKELHRLLKKDGFLIIDYGHQSHDKAKKKINDSKLWEIIKEEKDYLKCVPV